MGSNQSRVNPTPLTHRRQRIRWYSLNSRCKLVTNTNRHYHVSCGSPHRIRTADWFSRIDVTNPNSLSQTLGPWATHWTDRTFECPSPPIVKKFTVFIINLIFTTTDNNSSNNFIIIYFYFTLLL